MKKTSARRQSAAKQKRSASRKISTGKAGVGKSKAASTRRKDRISMLTGAAATAPVVYQTLRERVAAVDSNIGETRTLSDFLKSTGWQ